MVGSDCGRDIQMCRRYLVMGSPGRCHRDTWGHDHSQQGIGTRYAALHRAVGVQVRGGTRPLRTRPQPTHTPGSGVVPGFSTGGCLSIWLASPMMAARRRHTRPKPGVQLCTHTHGLTTFASIAPFRRNRRTSAAAGAQCGQRALSIPTTRAGIICRMPQAFNTARATYVVTIRATQLPLRQLDEERRQVQSRSADLAA